MKKLFLTAGLFLALAVSAQQREQNNDRPPKMTTEQQMKRFDDLNLSSAQKRKLQALFKERDAKFEKDRPTFAHNTRGNKQEDHQFRSHGKNKNEFDKKIQNILSKEQYLKFKAQHEKMGFKEGKRPEGFRRG